MHDFRDFPWFPELVGTLTVQSSYFFITVIYFPTDYGEALPVQGLF